LAQGSQTGRPTRNIRPLCCGRSTGRISAMTSMAGVAAATGKKGGAAIATPEKVAPAAVIFGQPTAGLGLGRREEEDRDVEADQLLKLPTGQLLKDAQADIRLGFVRKVYGILAAQLLLTVAVAAPLHLVAASWLQSHAWLLWAAVSMTFVTMCAMACCQQVTREYPTNYLVLFGFTIAEAVVVGFISASYTWQSVLLCAGLTAMIFFGLTAFACTTKVDFTGLGPYLFGALLSLCAWGFMVSLLWSLGFPMEWAVLLYDLVGVVIFVFYIIYDTQLILGGNHSQHEFGVDDYVFAALNLYLDIIQLFLHLLRLLGEKN